MPGSIVNQITSSTGLTVSYHEAQKFRAEHGDAVTYREARIAGFSNEQIANVYGYSKHEVDAYEASLFQGSKAGGRDRKAAAAQEQAQVNYRATVKTAASSTQDPREKQLIEQDLQARAREMEARAALDGRFGVETDPSGADLQNKIKAEQDAVASWLREMAQQRQEEMALAALAEEAKRKADDAAAS